MSNNIDNFFSEIDKYNNILSGQQRNSLFEKKSTDTLQSGGHINNAPRPNPHQRKPNHLTPQLPYPNQILQPSQNQQTNLANQSNQSNQQNQQNQLNHLNQLNQSSQQYQLSPSVQNIYNGPVPLPNQLSTQLPPFMAPDQLRGMHANSESQKINGHLQKLMPGHQYNEYNANNSNANNSKLGPNFHDSSYVKTTTIPTGTSLYHGSPRRIINPFSVNLGATNDRFAAIFSPSNELAMDYMGNCSLTNQKGFVHEFVSKKEIDSIYIVSAYDFQRNWDLKKITQMFCAQFDNRFGKAINGIAIYYPEQNNQFRVEYALCPNVIEKDLKYVGTTGCTIPRKMSDKYLIA
jgi:hypothetical protein